MTHKKIKTNLPDRRSFLGLGCVLVLFCISVARAEGPLSHCESYLGPVQSAFIQFRVNFLRFIPERDKEFDLNRRDITQVLKTDTGTFILERIGHNLTFEALEALNVNPYSPFKFFVNGFNTLDKGGHINGTWMFETAKSFATRATRDENPHLLTDNNLMFITWGIPEFITDDLIQMIPAYFKTMASYGMITDFVARTFDRMIDYVEYHRKLDESWPGSQAKRKYYESFQFFGHSLGSHLISDSIIRVRKQRPELRFGKLMGLDPANPCFISLEHGLSHVHLNESIKQLVVLHSNAGLAGLASEKANVEIVLNGGTFQPGCTWLDFGCHHARSTDILGYVDDQCQMIAYRCSSYQHFKMGACDAHDSSSTTGHDDKNFVLVNLNEQHRDEKELLNLLGGQEDQLRQLAKEDGHIDEIQRKLKRTAIERRRQQHLEKMNFFSSYANQSTGSPNYFVNTNAKFRTGLKSHCLQHYQLRLIVQYPSEKTQHDCPIGSFFLDKGESVRLELLYESLYESRRTLRTKDMSSVGTRNRAENVIKDVLYTSLINFRGQPKLFVGALLDNINLDKLSKCLESQEKDEDRKLNFILDVAFMSHIDNRVRHTFSSLLCGQWNNNSHIEKNHAEHSLVLELCKESQLTDTSDQINGILDKMKGEHLVETWKLSLLNSLFSLFVEWEPF